MILISILLILFLANISKSAVVEVQMGDNFFRPANVNISVGDTVRWVHIGNLVHTTTSGSNCKPNGIWNSGNMTKGMTFEYTFNNSGTYPYFCIPHCAMGMTGTVVVGGSTDPLSCSASASPSSGMAPLTVNFSAQISGGDPPYNVNWNFGDGSTGVGQNVQHIYTSTGNYLWTMEVKDKKNQSCTSSGNIVVESYNLTCSANASPSYGKVPFTVYFSGNVIGGVEPYNFLWEFGDGSQAVGSSTSHIYSLPGTYIWKMVVSDGNNLTCSVEGEIIAVYETYKGFISAVARAKGDKDTNWKTDLYILNPNSSSLNTTLYFVPAGEDGTKNYDVASFHLMPGEGLLLPNLIEDIFNHSGKAGNLRIEGSDPFLSTSRTYNDQGEKGTYGIFVPLQQENLALPNNSIIRENEKAVIFGIQQDENFRTNIGFTETSGIATVLKISFYTLKDTKILEDIPVNVPPYGWIQIPVPSMGLNSTGVFRAEVELEEGGAVLSYASVVDNRSGDAIFISGIRESQIDKTQQTIAVAARARGAYGTNWRTDLYLYNPHSGSTAYNFIYITPSGTFQSSYSLDSEEGVVIRDVIGMLFPSAGDNSAGALHINSFKPFLAFSRIYNEDNSGTYGIVVLGKGLNEMIGPGEEGYLPQLSSNEKFRCNIGFTEGSGKDTTLILSLKDERGNLLAEKTYFVPAWQNLQINYVFPSLGLSQLIDGAYAQVSVQSGGKIYPYASVVDNVSSDGIFVSP